MRAAINFRDAIWIRFESVSAQHNTTDPMGCLYVDRDYLDRHDSPDGFIRLTRLRLGNQVEHLIAILLTHASAQTILYSYTVFGYYLHVIRGRA